MAATKPGPPPKFVLHIEARLFPHAERREVDEDSIFRWIHANYTSLSTHQEIGHFGIATTFHQVHHLNSLLQIIPALLDAMLSGSQWLK